MFWAFYRGPLVTVFVIIKFVPTMTIVQMKVYKGVAIFNIHVYDNWGKKNSPSLGNYNSTIYNITNQHVAKM